MAGETVITRFWAKVNKAGPISLVRGVSGPCHVWIAARTGAGYGSFWDGQRVVYAHRYAYAQHAGAVPAGLDLDHRCGNRACCNPAHLEPVPHAENVRRGRGGAAQRAKTHCPQGHPYDEANTYHHPRGMRRCRTCQRDTHQRFRARRRAESFTTYGKVV